MEHELVQRLIQRVYRLEQEVERLRAAVDPEGATRQPEASAPPVMQRGATPPPLTAAPAARTPAVAARTADRDEANVVGSWLARVGAVAILIGAGFGFKYAVDRGYIGPSLRVAIGVGVGMAFVAWGMWARTKGWDLFAQAVTGGGLALVYLSVLAGAQLYDLYADGVMFLVLVIVAAGGGALALRYDSVGLAVLAAVGGFLNPFLVAVRTSDPSAQGIFIYLLGLNGVIVAVVARRWRALDLVALAGTAIVFIAVQDEASIGAAIGYASTLFVVFVSLPLVRRFVFEMTTRPDDLSVLVASSFAYFGFVAWRLDAGYDGWRGAFTAALALLFISLALLVKRAAEDDRLLSAAMLGLGTAFSALFVPMQWRDGSAIGIGWAIEGVFLVWLAATARIDRARVWGAVLVGLGVVAAAGQLSDRYPTEQLLTTGASAAMVMTIACVALAAALLAREDDPVSRQGALVGAVAANVLLVFWGSVELASHVEREVVEPAAREQGIAFALSALWGVYAALLLVAGVRLRARWLRYLAVSGFAIVVAKMVLSDIWLLRTSYRFIAFLGLGVILLASSLMYQRFRDLIEGERDADERV